MTPNALTADQLTQLKATLQIGIGSMGDALTAALLARQADLQAQMVDNRADLAPPAEDEDEPAEMRSDAREVRQQLTQSDINDLQRIRNALAAMEAGEYGDCIRCGKPIGFARLMAEPMTQHCLSCKTLLEAQARGR